MLYATLMLVPLVGGLAVGLSVADGDITFKFLVHRSIVTHGRRHL